jgi:hypothetical protein
MIGRGWMLTEDELDNLSLVAHLPGQLIGDQFFLPNDR